MNFLVFLKIIILKEKRKFYIILSQIIIRHVFDHIIKCDNKYSYLNIYWVSNHFTIYK